MNMNSENVSGKPLPGGEFTVKRWMAYLWADATRNDDDAFRHEEIARERGASRQLVPPGLAQQIINEASARVADVLKDIGYDLESTVLFGGQGFEFHRSLYVDEPYSVEGQVKDIVTKQGGSGEFDIVTLEYEVFDDDRNLAYTSDKQLIVYPDS